MPRTPEPAPGEYSTAVADALATELDKRRISARELARRSGRSSNYISMRFRHEGSFTLDDIDLFARVLRFDGGRFLATLEFIYLPDEDDVSRLSEDELRERFALAANTDETDDDIDPEAR